MDFKTWIAEVQDAVTFVIDPDEWRKYYDVELSPLDAIAQHRTDEDIQQRSRPRPIQCSGLGYVEKILISFLLNIASLGCALGYATRVHTGTNPSTLLALTRQPGDLVWPWSNVMKTMNDLFLHGSVKNLGQPACLFQIEGLK